MRAHSVLTVRGGLLALVISLAACGATTQRPADTATAPLPGEQVMEIMPGLLQGYLSSEEQLDSKVFTLPAPAQDSAMQALDTAWSESMLALHGTPRWELATRDANLAFPAAADVFSCSLGIRITEQDTPSLYMLLRRTLTDAGLATYSAKNTYQRRRPFMVNGAPTCTPDEEEVLRGDGSYPSGHTAIGWAWALILTELSPAQADAILARGRSFGESRNVCNVHWYSDVVAGRLVGAAALAKLQSNPQFLTAMDAARRDIETARAAWLSPVVDCAAEEAALNTPLQ